MSDAFVVYESALARDDVVHFDQRVDNLANVRRDVVLGERDHVGQAADGDTLHLGTVVNSAWELFSGKPAI